MSWIISNIATTIRQLETRVKQSDLIEIYMPKFLLPACYIDAAKPLKIETTESSAEKEQKDNNGKSSNE